MSMINGKRIVLGVTGSIAAYKAVNVLRTLIQEQADVSVVMTDAAKQFITPLTFEVLSGRPVATNIFGAHQDMPHLSLPGKADVMVIAPATANIIAKCALGLADDLLSTMLLTTGCPLVLAPAMDGGMWEHPAVQAHTQTLRQRGVTVLDPEEGSLASGQVGKGRLPSEEVILSAICAALCPQQDLVGQRVLVSAGPTREPIDAVRFISNPSTGKMGYALAEAAAKRGAEVVLVSGPTALPCPCGVEMVPVVTVDEMYDGLAEKFPWATMLVMAAAVGDFRPCGTMEATGQVLAGSSTEEPPSRAHKMKKRQWNGEPLALEPTKDILGALSACRKDQVLVGFAAETDSLLANAKAKLNEKRLDLVVANLVEKERSPFGGDDNEVTILNRKGTISPLPRMSKRKLADQILDAVQSL
ncbi:MAG: bifunctional phosphopantothenoylcysteine decarboxylase/phosphopantothenate--cysteine ligase CoaBC [Nitrospirales bacterium]|nr:bifunctional phosphopantothenoylcysteine decarboxylase/phosphopantothenate--cysteine ligase CoaBC [Nitrospirales bacterium]